MKGKLPVRLPDVVIILLFAGLTAFSAYAFHMARVSGVPMVTIQGPNNRTWVFALDSEETVRVRGILGDDTVIMISGGEVWAESSPCDNQVCVGMGRINATSWWPWVACIPNNVFFMVEGSRDAGGHVDGAVR
ncbi:MAG: NusG domain II-containing protein [Treponema sp.]|nr:NusG domain II-containing protein [Treponema sp.]